MKNKNTIIENIASLKAEQTELTVLQRDFDEICNEKKRDCYASFKKYFSQAKVCLEKAPLIIKPIVERFPSVFSQQEGALYLNGKKVPSASFNHINCFDVYEKAQSVFLAKSKTILSDIATVRLSGQTMKLLDQLCANYNTIFDFYKSVNALFQAKWNDEYQALCLKKASDEKTLAGIPKKLEKLEKELQVYEEEQQKLRERLFFHCDFPVAETFADSAAIPIAYREENGEIGAFLEWDYEKENILCIKAAHELEKSADLFNLLQNTVCRFINNFPAGVARFLICDLCGDFTLRNFSARLVDAKIEEMAPKLIYGYSENKEVFSENFSDTLKMTADLITSRTALYDDINTFNANNPESFSTPLLVVINGFTKESGLSKAFLSNLPNGTKTGVYYLVTQFESEQDEHYMRNDRYGFDDVFGAKILQATESDSGMMLAYRENVYMPTKVEDSFDIQTYSKLLLKRLSSQNNAIDLKGIIEGYTRDDTDFSEELIIPIGRSDTATIKTMSFSSKDSSAHCVVSGTTGSGKSSLLQAIILGGAYHYSPDELEFYLIDMKDGSAFYKENGYDYSKLKHVRMMAANCKQKDLRDFISFITETKTHCSEASDIVAYNKNRSGSEKMKRTVIIIDEYTMIEDQECIANLEKIAAQGRSFGVSLILTSQNISASFSKVLEKISTSVEFKNIKLGALIERDGKCRIPKNDALYLDELKGNCLGRIGMGLSKFRVAYTPEQNALIEQINRKYSAYQSVPTIVIGNETRQIKPFAENGAVSNVTHDGSISVNLGKNLFGMDVSCTMSNKANLLLLLGDAARAQSIEYTFLSAAKNAVSANDRAIFHLNFGENIITEEMEEACKAYTEISIQPLELLYSVRFIYKIYEERKQAQKGRRRSGRGEEQNAAPILVVLHDCAEYESLLQDGVAEEKEADREVVRPKQPASSATATAKSVKMSDLEIPDLSQIGDFSQLTQEASFQNLVAEPKPNTEYGDLDASKMLLEVLKNGAKYNIYFIVHLENEVPRLFGESLSSLFDRTVIIPEVCTETAREKMQILSALNSLNKDRVKNEIEKSGDLTEQELYRCYYLAGNDYTQLIPYEWR